MCHCCYCSRFGRENSDLRLGPRRLRRFCFSDQSDSAAFGCETGNLRISVRWLAPAKWIGPVELRGWRKWWAVTGPLPLLRHLWNFESRCPGLCLDRTETNLMVISLSCIEGKQPNKHDKFHMACDSAASTEPGLCIGYHIYVLRTSAGTLSQYQMYQNSEKLRGTVLNQSMGSSNPFKKRKCWALVYHRYHWMIPSCSFSSGFRNFASPIPFGRWRSQTNRATFLAKNCQEVSVVQRPAAW